MIILHRLSWSSLLGSLLFLAFAVSKAANAGADSTTVNHPSTVMAEVISFSPISDPDFPTDGPGDYRLVLAVTLGEECSLPDYARWYFLGLIMSESSLRHLDEDGNVKINEIGAVGLGQLLTDLFDYPSAPYEYGPDVLDAYTNTLLSCKHFKRDLTITDGNIWQAIGRYKGFADDPYNEYVGQAVCYAETRLTGPCNR